MLYCSCRRAFDCSVLVVILQRLALKHKLEFSSPSSYINSFVSQYIKRRDWHAPHNDDAVVFIAHRSLWLVLIALVGDG